MVETTPIAPDLAAQLKESAAIDADMEKLRKFLDEQRDAVEAAKKDDAQGVHEELRTDCKLEEIAGMGRYAVPRRSGWQALLDLIHDPSVDINFSAKEYPTFDQIIGDHFGSMHLIDPSDEKYEPNLFNLYDGRYARLRDNLAAVRNQLMQVYFAHPPEGMTPEKAQAAMKDIAEFVGDGLHNNIWITVFGIKVFELHNPLAPSIDFNRAAAGGGDGAQYIYDCILARQRHSNWTRPFAPLLKMFGVKGAMDTMLPETDEFFNVADEALADAELDEAEAHNPEAIAKAEQSLLALEARRAALHKAMEARAQGMDLDHLGTVLQYQTEQAQGTRKVSDLTEPVKHDAVDAARDILKKLKLSFGTATIRDALTRNPTEDLKQLGTLTAFGDIFARAIAWTSNNGSDTAVLAHPAIAAATRALGTLAYAAKAQALTLAQAVGNAPAIQSLSMQLQALSRYRGTGQENMGQLLDRLDRGMQAAISLPRSQNATLSGAAVGHSPTKELGHSTQAPPTAGQSAQRPPEAVGHRNATDNPAQDAQRVAGQQKAQQQQAALQVAAQAQQHAQSTRSGTGSTGQTAMNTPARPSSAQRRMEAAQQKLEEAKTRLAAQQRAPQPPPLAQGKNAAQQQLQQAALYQEEQQRRQIEAQRINQAALAKAQAAAKATQMQAAMNKAQASGAPPLGTVNLAGVNLGALSTKGLTGPAVATSNRQMLTAEMQAKAAITKAQAEAAKGKITAEEAERIRQQQMAALPPSLPTGPSKGGRGM